MPFFHAQEWDGYTDCFFLMAQTCLGGSKRGPAASSKHPLLTKLGCEMAVLTAASMMARAFSGSLPGPPVYSVNRTCIKIEALIHAF